MQFTTGSYTGNGIDNRWITGVGFQPDLVIVKADASQYAIWRSSSMPAGKSAVFSPPASLFTNAIQAFAADGFQVGTHATANQNGIEYFYSAFRDDGAGDFDVGTYAGNGVDSRNLDIVGFQPTILWIKGDRAAEGVWRIAENAGDDTVYFCACFSASNRIQSLRPLGFQVGSSAWVNASGYNYYYVAFADAAGFIETGSYAGNGVDDRNINVGFEPDLVFVKGGAKYAVLRIDTMGAGDSGPHHNVTPAPNQIQQFAANVFQVGTNSRVNQSGTDYYWAAWKAGTSGPTTTTTTTVTFSTTSTSTTTTTTSTTTLTTTTLPFTPVPGTSAVLRICDKDGCVNFLKRKKQSGYRLCGWTPRVADYKRGGIWQDSPIAEGRRLAQRRFGNVIETMNLSMSGHNLETLIRESQDLRRLMEKASNYWWADWQNDPIWLEARAKCETNARYAILHRGKILVDNSPYEQPFMERRYGRTAARNLNLILERGHWMSLPPERSASVLASARECYGSPERCYGNVDLTQALQPVTDHVYVGNKRNEANITHIFRCIPPAGFSVNLVGTAPFDLLPAVPAVGDMVYFGIQNTPPDWGYFSSLVFDLENAHSDITGIVWEYWNGAWVAITISEDNTQDWFNVAFGKTGINSVVWELGNDLSTTTVNGITGAWVRARVVSVGGAPTPPRQQNRDVYTVTWPYLEIDSGQVGGDIVALARYEMVSAGMEADDVIVGLRSLSRGADFSAYLNCGGHQNPPGISVVTSGNCSVGIQGEAPARYVVQYTWGADGKFEICIGPSTAAQYYGIYHVYMRGYHAGAGWAEDTTFSVSFEQGSGKVVQQKLTGLYFTPYAKYELVDLGRLELSPPSLLDSGEEYNENKIVVDVSGVADIVFYDFILIPIDEWAGRFVDLEQGANSTNRLSPGRLLEFESVRHPKQQIRANLWARNTDRIAGHWDKRVNGPVVLQANVSQRLWVLASLIDEDLDTIISRPEILTWFSVEAVQRYLSMRGDR